MLKRYKAQLVAKGYSQIERFDYQETLCLVVKYTIVTVFMVVAATQKWTLRQLDVNIAFLHGDLEEVYMKIPPSYSVQGEYSSTGIGSAVDFVTTTVGTDCTNATTATGFVNASSSSSPKLVSRLHKFLNGLK